MNNLLYSERKTGKKKSVDFAVLKQLCNKRFRDFLRVMTSSNRFREPILDHDGIQHYFLAKTKKLTLNPLAFESNIQTENDLFDMLECAYQFLKDHIADKDVREIFAFQLNKDALNSYGYEMSWDDGVIRHKPEDGMDMLVNENVPFDAIPSAEQKITDAIYFFFKRNATEEDKKRAIKELGDLLEHVRKELKEIPHLQADENLIFKMLNEYSIRHHNNKQMELPEPYLTWFFYLLLNTIKTFLKLKGAKSVTK